MVLSASIIARCSLIAPSDSALETEKSLNVTVLLARPLERTLFCTCSSVPVPQEDVPPLPPSRFISMSELVPCLWQKANARYFPDRTRGASSLASAEIGLGHGRTLQINCAGSREDLGGKAEMEAVWEGKEAEMTGSMSESLSFRLQLESPREGKYRQHCLMQQAKTQL